jgi:small conductance mechanosensitive channel
MLAVVPQIVAAVLFLIAGFWLARWAERATTKLLDRHRLLDLTFRGVLTAFVRYSILLIAVVAALQQIGFQTSSILAGVGGILVAIGLALQGTLSNLAAGLMLLWLRPFRVGETIETASVSGTVTEIGLFATEIRRADGVYVFVPNTDLWNKPVSNVSRMPARMVELKFAIKRTSDVGTARERLLALAAAEDAVHKTPAPIVFVSGVSETAIILSLTAWVDTGRFQHISHDLAERATAALMDL